MEEIILQDKDRERLSELYETAQRTPLKHLIWSALSGKDMLSIAWNNVRTCMDDLGKKYGFEPTLCSTNSKTGVVKIIK